MSLFKSSCTINKRELNTRDSLIVIGEGDSQLCYDILEKILCKDKMLDSASECDVTTKGQLKFPIPKKMKLKVKYFLKNCKYI